MSNAPCVSVVIPTYNSARYLALTLDSVLGQSVRDIEVVLYDDGSSDDTLRIGEGYAARDPRVRVIRGDHGGSAKARNGGFAATDSRSQYITFFDHDDVWEPGAVASLLSALELQPSCQGAHGVARCIDSDGNLFPGDDHTDNSRNRVAVADRSIVKLPQSAPTTFESELVKNYITTPGTSVVRRTALQAVGRFEASTVPCDDWDMNLRIARLGPFAFVDEILLNWRRHPAATSNSRKRWRMAYMTTRQRAIDDRTNTRAQREAARYAAYSDAAMLQRAAARRSCVEARGRRHTSSRVPSCSARLFRSPISREWQFSQDRLRRLHELSLTRTSLPIAAASAGLGANGTSGRGCGYS